MCTGMNGCKYTGMKVLKKAKDNGKPFSLELKLWTVLNHHIWGWEPNPRTLQEKPVLLATVLSLQPQKKHFKVNKCMFNIRQRGEKCVRNELRHHSRTLQQTDAILLMLHLIQLVFEWSGLTCQLLGSTRLLEIFIEMRLWN